MYNRAGDYIQCSREDLGVVSVNASMSAVGIEDGSLRPLLPDRQAAACAMQDSDESNFILLLSTLNISGWMVLSTDGFVITFRIHAHHDDIYARLVPISLACPRYRSKNDRFCTVVGCRLLGWFSKLVNAI